MSTAAAPKRVQSDYQVVDNMPIFPAYCRTCTGSSGPAIDTLREDRIGRIYVCLRCVSLLGRVAGIVKGERHTELLRAGETVAELEAQVAARDLQIQEQLATNVDYKNRLEATATLLEHERGRGEAMRHQLATIEEQARQAKQTV